ncbi:MAG: hypothetical protein HY874_11545 [Chloroflexi bacterium]|nr:hypothetical protein [Chloroflexota bacterium]
MGNWLNRNLDAAAGTPPGRDGATPPADTGAGSGAFARLSAITLTVVAVVLAWAGQAITTRDLPHSLAMLDVLQHFFSAYKNPREISAAMLLLVAGAVILGLASRRNDDGADGDEMLSDTRPLLASTAAGKGRNSHYLSLGLVDAIIMLAVAAGIALWALFLWRLYGDHYQHRLNFVLLAALLLLAAPLVKRDFFDHRVRWYFNRTWPLHVAFGLVVMGAFIYLNAHDLRSWKYAAVGDEYNNFYYALRIAGGFWDVNPWSHRGADDLFSVAGAMGQALFLKAGNGDNFAWKLFSVCAAASAFIPFYFLIRELFRTRVAVVATVLFASSHYIFGYAHHFLYLDGMLPTTLGLWLLVIGLRRDSALALFASGMALAGGFYTFESGRAAVAVVAVFMLTFGVRSFRPAVFLPLAGGFILLALPLFATDGPYHVLDQMFGQSAVSYSSDVTGDRWHRVLVNIQYSFVSFNYMAEGRHYVWGSMADPLTAMLFVLGLGVTVFRVKQPAYRLLCTWWLIEVAFNGFSNPYPQPPISRMHAVVPPVAALAALGFDAIIRPFTDVSPYRRLVSDRNWRFAGGTLAIAALLPVVLYLNLYRFWYQLPRRFGTPTNETVVLRIYREPQCEGRNVVMIAKDPLSLLPKMLGSYHVKPEPVYLYYPTALMLVSSPVSQTDVAAPLPDVGEPDCIIVQPGDNGAQLQAVLSGIPKRFPGYAGVEYRDPSRIRLAYLFVKPQE